MFASTIKWMIAAVGLFGVIAAVIVFGGRSSSPTSSQSVPKVTASTGNLAFALTSSSDSKLSTLVAASGIDGLALQEGWNRLEPSYGTYDWSKLDAALSLAKKNGKLVTLHLIASPHTPSWLAGRGAQYVSITDSHGQTVSDVVPWDSVYLTEYTTFLNALAAHLSSAGFTSTVFDVSDVVPVPEMNLVMCQNGMIGSSLAYDRAKYVAAWEQMGDALYTAFPSAHVFVSSPLRDMICIPAQDSSFYPEIMNYFSKYGHTFWMYAADLTAQGSQRAENHLDLVSQSGLGFQTIWSATNDPTGRMLGTYPDNLRAAVCKGEKDGGTYFEIYQADVLSSNTTIQKAISAVHDPSLCS